MKKIAEFVSLVFFVVAIAGLTFNFYLLVMSFWINHYRPMGVPAFHFKDVLPWQLVYTMFFPLALGIIVGFLEESFEESYIMDYIFGSL